MPHRAESADVLVIGGGVIGLATAWRLAARGVEVIVLDRGEPGTGTTGVAAGMLAPVAEADPSEEPLLRLGTASARAYPDFIEQLRECSGLDPGYLPCGTLMVARDRDEAESLERELEIRERLGLAVNRLRPSQARAAEPGLAPTLRAALELPDDHVIDPRRLIAALVIALERAGGRLRAGAEVVGIEVGSDGVRGVRLTGGELLTARRVVVAAGVWSGALGGIPDGARVPIRPVKGQVMRMHDPAGAGLLTRVLRMPPAYVAPRGDGRYVVGATMEERGFDTTVTAGAIFGLLRDAIELLPGLSDLVIDELSSGLRPGTPDNAPAIGRGAVPGLLWATGHFRHGVLLAPITAELIAGDVCDDAAAGVPPEFSPLRFAPVEAVRR